MDQRVTYRDSSSECTAPGLGELLTAFCFGDLEPEARNAFVAHLAGCAACATEVQHLSKAVDLLRNDQALNHSVLTGSLPSVLGLSDRLDDWLGGHRAFVITWAFMYGILFATALITEVSNSYGTFGRTSYLLAGPLVGWFVTTTILAAWADWKRITLGRTDGLVWSPGIMVAAAVVATVVLRMVFPNELVVFARFETHPLHAGINKFVAFNLPMALAFFTVPLHYVMSMQRELRSPRRELACQQLERGRGLLPRGCFYVPTVFLGIVFLALIANGYLGATYLFDNLLPGPYRHLFISMVQARIAWYLVTALAALCWYAYAMNELRRECAAWRLVGEI